MIGITLGNRYQIIEQVGCGGMAIVYKAKDQLLNRFVAVKVLRSEFNEDEEFVRRFNIESQAAASFSHQNIVPIYDVGQQNDTHYIVMEYVEGITLKEYIDQKKGDIYWKEATDFSMQICSALEHAHSKHIIHRDIKPQNIIVTPSGQLKVTDFGIARAANNATTSLGKAALGSAHYISPEQARGGYTDQRTDIYSLGVVMYELFTGKLPFDGESSVAVAMQHIQKQPVPPTMINPNIPKSIENIIFKAMSKEQRLRYESAKEMLADIRKVYTDPESKIDIVSDDTTSQEFGTKKMPAIKTNADDFSMDNNDNNITDSEGINRKVAKGSKKKQKDGDKLTIALAVITSVVLIIALGVFIGKVFMRGTSGEILTPSIIGMTVDEARDYLDEEKFTVTVEKEENNEKFEKGQIISQDPDVDDPIRTPREILVVVSLGEKTVTLDNYTGDEYQSIEYDLTSEKNGLEVVIEQEASDTIPSGVIIRQYPPEGAVLKAGDKVTLYVSKGMEEENTDVPNLLGLTEADARISIERSGLSVGSVTSMPSTQVKGVVINQNYNEGDSVPKGTKINIVISDGTSQTVNPDDGKTTKHLSITLPTDRPNVTVKLVCDGVTVYEKSHSTASGEADISIRGKNTVDVKIYFDNEYVTTKTVKFN